MNDELFATEIVIVAPAGVPENQEQGVPWVPSPDTNIAVAASDPVRRSLAPEYGLAGVRATVGETPASTHAQVFKEGTVAVGTVAARAGESAPNP